MQNIFRKNIAFVPIIHPSLNFVKALLSLPLLNHKWIAKMQRFLFGLRHYLTKQNSLMICFFLFSQEVSIFIFDKKKVERSLVRPKRNTITEFLKTGVSNLKLNRHARILPVLSGPEDCSDSLAFVSEPLLGSLANILRFPIHILFLGHKLAQ